VFVICAVLVSIVLRPTENECYYSRTDADDGYSPQRLSFPNGPDAVSLFVDGQPTTGSPGRFESELLVVLALLVVAKSLDLSREQPSIHGRLCRVEYDVKDLRADRDIRHFRSLKMK